MNNTALPTIFNYNTSNATLSSTRSMSCSIQREDILKKVGYGIASLSVLSSFLVIVTCIYLLYRISKKALRFVLKIVLCIAFSDMAYLISRLMGSNESGEFLCYLQSFIDQIGSIGSVLSTVSISISMNYCFWKSVDFDHMDAYFVKAFVSILGIVFISTLLPLLTDSHGPSGQHSQKSHCWLKDESRLDHFWRMATFHVPLWISIIYMLIVYCKVWKHIKSNNNETKILFAYPLILIVCWTPATVRRIYEIFYNDTPCLLQELHACFVVLLGFLDGLIFVWSIWNAKELNIFADCQQHESTTTEKCGDDSTPQQKTLISISLGASDSTQMTSIKYSQICSQQHNKNIFDTPINANKTIQKRK